MAIDHNFVSKDLRALNHGRNLSFSAAGEASAADESADDQPSARKVKLLCSFGGKILPRPSDGVLRYAGGQTRIISVRRDASLHELCRKMSDVYGGSVAIRYQLPDQDLDALVSVSSAEDLDNMMDEYDRFADTSGDGSAKLRVFLSPKAEFASGLAESLSAGPALIDPFDAGQKYLDAVNGCSASEASAIYPSYNRPKGSAASFSSTQNSDAGLEGYNNEGTSPALLSPTAGVSTSFDPSSLAFAGAAASMPTSQDAQGFLASSTVGGQTMMTAQPLNTSHVPPYGSLPFVHSHQVHYVSHHDLNLAAALPRMVSMVSDPQHAYLSPMPTPPASMTSQTKPVQGKGGPFSEEDQFSGRFVQPVTDPNFKVFQQPLSQLPPLQPYELHLLPPLSKGQGLRFEDCQMCQKALPHVHSDRFINELGNVSGIQVPSDRPTAHTFHFEDTAKLLGQQREVSVAMMEGSVEPKVEHIENRDPYGIFGGKSIPDSVLEKEELFIPTEKLGSTKPRPSIGAVGLPGDTQASSSGVFVSPPQSQLDATYQWVLHGDNFHTAKALHPTATFTPSGSVHTSNGTSPSPPHTFRDDSVQQKNVLLDSADGGEILHPSGTTSLSSASQTSYGMSLRPPFQAHYDESLQRQRPPTGTRPPLFPAMQGIPGKHGYKDSTVNNVGYNVLDPMSNGQVYAKQVDGIMETLNASTFDILRSTDQLKSAGFSNAGVSKDFKPESLSLLGDNHTLRTQNGTNALLSSNAFISPAINPVEMYVNPINLAGLNDGLSREMKLDSSVVVEQDNGTVRLHHGASKTPSINTFMSTELLSKENSMLPINPLLSTMMNSQNFELANTNKVSTMTGSSVPYLQNVERAAKPYLTNQLISGVSPYATDSDYINATAVGTSMVWNDEISQVQHLLDEMAVSQRGNDPFQPSSLLIHGHGDQFQETFALGSHPDNEISLESLRNINAHQARLSVSAINEPAVSGDVFIENDFPMVQGPDIAKLLEEGALQPPVDWLIKDPRLDPVAVTKDSRADYANQDLRDLAEQVVESVLQPSIPPVSLSPFSGPMEEGPPFLKGSNLSVDIPNSHNATVLGEQRIEDSHGRQSDKLHAGFLITNDFGRLQVIKNSDLEELQELGSGTFGTVYHGKWRGSDVAIKRINDRCFAGKPSEQEKMRTDFWNEASKLADLHHPNVVAFYGVVIDGPGGSFATVTEFMVNGSLRNALQRNDKTLDRRKRHLIAMDVAFGMEYLHGKNIVHFDLKSDNLLVNLRDPQRPICKVGDLGLSKVKCQTLISGGVRGTLPWMAPELLNGSSKLVSEKVDVFSFGIVMWELLTGEEPYSDLHYGAIIGGIVSNTLRPAVPDSCDPEWRNLMEQCWSAEPNVRPSFTEIADRLRSMAASLPQKGQAQK